MADAVVTISINAEESVPKHASADRLVKRLAREDLPIQRIELTAARSEIQPTILSLAAEEGLDMLVMGAYGQSRLQEGILGGVTRGMVPVLMSH